MLTGVQDNLNLVRTDERRQPVKKSAAATALRLSLATAPRSAAFTPLPRPNRTVRPLASRQGRPNHAHSGQMIETTNDTNKHEMQNLKPEP